MPNRFVTATLLTLRPLIKRPASWVVAHRLGVRHRTARRITNLGFVGLELLRVSRKAKRRR